MTDRKDSTEIGKVKIGGYIDAYYVYDFNMPSNGNRPYAVSSSRTGEININLAYIDIRYQTNSIRARLVPGFGTYVNANYANEPGTLKNMIEAYGGVKLSKKKDIWLDAGVMGSPFSNETAISKDHLMYSRSLSAEYVPYYLSGIRLSLPLTTKLTGYFYLINGWQHIVNPNHKLAFTTQIEYKVSNKFLLNWNVFWGNENSIKDSSFGNRFFTDLYAIVNPEGKLSLTTSLYYGRQQFVESHQPNKPIDGEFATWAQNNIIVRYRLSKKLSISGRVETFIDFDQVMLRNENLKQSILNLPAGPDKLNSYGLCLDYKLSDNAIFRLEYRHYNSFTSDLIKPESTDDLLFGNLTVWF